MDPSEKIILPADMLILIANENRYCWYAIAVSDTRGAKYARDRVEAKKVEYSERVVFSLEKSSYVSDLVFPGEEFFVLPNKRKHGKYTRVGKYGEVLWGLYVDGKKEGLWTKISHRESVEETTEYKNGLLDGCNLLFDEDGKIYSSTIYRKGKKHGQHISWHRLGFTPSEKGEYFEGEKVGLWKSWDLRRKMTLSAYT